MSEKKRYRNQLLMPILQVVAFANPGYLHLHMSLNILFERCLRLRTLAARLREMNPDCLLRSAGIMAAAAARCNSLFPRMFATTEFDTSFRVQHESGLDRPYQEHLGRLEKAYKRSLQGL